MNPNARIMALKAGESGYVDTVSASRAIRFAAHNGAKIVSASWGGYFAGTDVPDRTLYDAIKDFQDAGGLFVASAGNGGKNHDSGTFAHRLFPSGYSIDNPLAGGGTLTGLTSVVSVAATNQNDALPSFSDYGGTSVNIGAPGTNIYSTMPGEISANTESLTGMTLGQTPAGFTKTGSGFVALTSNILMADSGAPFQRNATVSIQKSVNTSALSSPTLRFTAWCDSKAGTNNDRMYLEYSTGGSFVSQGYLDEDTIYSYADSLPYTLE